MILPQDVPSQRGSVSAFAERLVADIPPRLYLPEDQARPDAGDLVFRVGYRSEAERIAALVGPRDLGQAVDASTDHALLVLLGEYARQPAAVVVSLWVLALSSRHRPPPAVRWRRE